jgi:hypothetical protein
MTFKPGQSGNPAGRPRGARNKRTILAEQILDDHAGEVTRAAIDLARQGDGVALRVCMDRIAPPLKHRLLEFDLPALKTAADAVVAADAILQGVAHGRLTIPEADGLMKLVRTFTLVLAAAERAKRSAQVDAQEDAARPHARDFATDDDDAAPIAARHPEDVAGAAAATRKAPADDRNHPVSRAPSGARDRTHDRAPRPAWAGRRRAENASPADGSAGLGSFGANPKTVVSRAKDLAPAA